MEVGGNKLALKVYQSEAQFGGIQSAVAYVYKAARVEQPTDMAKEMSIFINGMRRTISAAKKHLGLKIAEGKDAMKWEVFELLTKKLFYSDKKQDVFNHLFLCLLQPKN